jgi:phosphopentomutase
MDQYATQAQAITIKVQDGTTRGDGNLCKTCRHSHIVRGNNNQEFVKCTYADKVMVFQVAECNRHFPANQPALYEMEEIAWRIVTKQAGRNVGFLNPQQFQKYEEEHERANTPRVVAITTREENGKDTTTTA